MKRCMAEKEAASSRGRKRQNIFLKGDSGNRPMTHNISGAAQGREKRRRGVARWDHVYSKSLSSSIDGRRLWAGEEGASEKVEFLDTAEVVELLDTV